MLFDEFLLWAFVGLSNDKEAKPALFGVLCLVLPSRSPHSLEMAGEKDFKSGTKAEERGDYVITALSTFCRQIMQLKLLMFRHSARPWCIIKKQPR